MRSRAALARLSIPQLRPREQAGPGHPGPRERRTRARASARHCQRPGSRRNRPPRALLLKLNLNVRFTLPLLNPGFSAPRSITLLVKNDCKAALVLNVSEKIDDPWLSISTLSVSDPCKPPPMIAGFSQPTKRSFEWIDEAFSPRRSTGFDNRTWLAFRQPCQPS